MRLPGILAPVVAAVLATGAASMALVGSETPTRSESPTAGAGRAVVFGKAAWPVMGSISTTQGTSLAPADPKPPDNKLGVPAAGVPLSSSADPVSAAPSSGRVQDQRATILPTPTAQSLPSVRAFSKAVTADAVVMAASSLTPAERTALQHLKGVAGTEVVDTGTVGLAGAPVVAFGVDPDTFRAYTPPSSASTDSLWRYLKGGSLVSSYSMADDRALKLGSTETVSPSGADSTVAPARGWLGAFASIGLPGVDLLVDQAYSPLIGLTPDSGVIVSAPNLPGVQLQSELQSVLPGAAVELLSPRQLPDMLTGNAVGSVTRQQIVAAALSRVGSPYVWGGAGPAVFDCSGLVQWSYRQAGILMPRVAAQQYLTGNHIPLAAAQPGDLLFWAYDASDPGYVDHEAMYIGNGLMVVAAHTGTNVQVTAVPTSDFMGAVEVVLEKS